MCEMLYNDLLFSSQELMVMFALSGVDRLPLPVDAAPANMSERDVELQVFGMFQRGLFFWDDAGACKWRPDVGKMVQDIRSAKEHLRIDAKENAETLVCFCSEEVAILEKSENDADAIRVHTTPRNFLIQELRERGILPKREAETFAADVDAGDAAFPGELFALLGRMAGELGGLQSQGDPLEELMQMDAVQTVLRVTDAKTEKETRAAVLLRGGLFDYAAFLTEANVRIEPYTEDALYTFLRG